jgi:hypothetical protein
MRKPFVGKRTKKHSFDDSEEVKSKDTVRRQYYDIVKLNGFNEKSNGNDHKARYNYLIC